jgi:hypothetical protein
MSEPSPDRAHRPGSAPLPLSGARNIPALLSALHAEKRSCTVVLSGAPGGGIHLRDGLVVAVETPGAPGVEALLLRSGRLTEEAWAEVRAADPAHERLREELVTRGLLGAAELEITGLAALYDAAFALSLTSTVDWEVTGERPLLHTGAGVTPERLVAETSRRIGMLAMEPGATARFARARPRATAGAGGGPGAGGGSRLPSRLREVLTATDGRRTPRDLAFALGRGLFAVMLDLRRLIALNLVEDPGAPVASGRPSTAPRTPGPAAPRPAAPASTLPRRNPGHHLPDPSAPPPVLP